MGRATGHTSLAQQKLAKVAAACFAVGALSSPAFLLDGASGDIGRVLTGREAENRASTAADHFLSRQFNVENLTGPENKTCAQAKLVGTLFGGTVSTIALTAVTGYGGIAAAGATLRGAQAASAGYRAAIGVMAIDDTVMTADTIRSGVEFAFDRH